MKQDGFALVLVLLVVAAIELVTLSTLALATHESLGTAAHERSLAASRAAEAALRRLIRNWPIPAIDSLQISQSTMLRDTTSVVVSVRRNTWGQYLAIGAAPAGQSWIREIAVLETIDFHRAMQEANQVIVTAGPISAPNARFLSDPTPCPLPAVPPGNDTIAAAMPGYAFAGLSWNELASVADTGLAYSAGNLTLPAGPHSGVLVVDGALTVRNGADFTGVAVVNGQVVIEDGVHVTGAVIVRGMHTVAVGVADLVYSRCAVGRALLQTPGARRLVRSQRRFIPAF